MPRHRWRWPFRCLVFCVAFGLSMDYEFFVLSRIIERHHQGADLHTTVGSTACPEAAG